jgi:plastocyanin
MDPMQQQPNNATYVSASAMETAANNDSRRRRTRTLIVAALVAVAGVAALFIWNNLSDKAVNAEAPAASVAITPDGFTPATIKIKKGEDVAWVSQDDAVHQVYADQQVIPGLDSAQPLSDGDTYIFTFEESGTYNYYDPLAPAQYQGTVIVEE